MVEFTTVLGVDKHHLEELKLSWVTWLAHKPEVTKNVIIFYDRDEVTPEEIRIAIYPNEYQLVPWPSNSETVYEGDPGNKWKDPQRLKMFSGFVHVPALYVRTPYWLKIDTDTIATGHSNWIDKDWFKNDPGIVAQQWGLTKPADQMAVLDKWAADLHLPSHPLRLYPESPKDSKIKHHRIISWCGFFNSDLTRMASEYARFKCGQDKLPVASQDGYMWYMAKRLNFEVNRVDMKRIGWKHVSRNLREEAEASLVAWGF